MSSPKALWPQHVGIIMDGNGRWANTRGWKRVQGHIQGADLVMSVVEEAISLNLKALSLFCFSTENWKRPDDEVNFLMDLMYKFAESQMERMHKLNIKIRVFGQYHRAPERLRKQLDIASELTKNNTGLSLNFLVSYGGRLDILKAAQETATLVQEGKIKPEDITEELFSQHLYTKDVIDPDLIIRTSGEFRISNFMLWQSAYAEFYVIDKLWPEFKREDLRKACEYFSNRDRRFGGVNTTTNQPTSLQDPKKETPPHV